MLLSVLDAHRMDDAEAAVVLLNWRRGRKKPPTSGGAHERVGVLAERLPFRQRCSARPWRMSARPSPIADFTALTAATVVEVRAALQADCGNHTVAAWLWRERLRRPMRHSFRRGRRRGQQPAAETPFAYHGATPGGQSGPRLTFHPAGRDTGMAHAS
jgi:hypothetical protein